MRGAPPHCDSPGAGTVGLLPRSSGPLVVLITFLLGGVIGAMMGSGASGNRYGVGFVARHRTMQWALPLRIDEIGPFRCALWPHGRMNGPGERMPELTVSLLGPPRVELDGVPVTSCRASGFRQPTPLLLRLVATLGHPRSLRQVGALGASAPTQGCSAGRLPTRRESMTFAT